MSRHHHRRFRAMFVDRLQRLLGVELGEDHHRDPTHQESHAVQRTRVVHRPHHQMSPESGETIGLHSFQVFGHGVTTGEHRGRQFGSLRSPRRSRGVQQIGSRLHVERRVGRITMVEPLAPRRDSRVVDVPADHFDGRPFGSRQLGRRHTTLTGLGSDEQQSRFGVDQDVGSLVGGQMEVDRNGRRAAEQTPEMSESGFGGILGEHRDASAGSEVGRQRVVGRAIQNVADRRPTIGATRIAHRDLIGSFDGEFGGESGHVRTLEQTRIAVTPRVVTHRATRQESRDRLGCCGSRRTGRPDPDSADGADDD